MVRVWIRALTMAFALSFALFVAGCSGGGYSKGDVVDIEWKGKWWKGTVIEVKGDTYRVHYTGWSKSWDEDVPKDRLRKPTGDAAVGKEKEPAAPAAK